MTKRKELSPPDYEGGLYFASNKKDVEFISSGCQVFDCALSGGYPVSRIVNIVGDRSTGKSLLAIEACANFAHQYPNGNIWYAEAEAAFDVGYAAALGLPVDRVEFIEECCTVEDLYENLEAKLKTKETDSPCLYILDSLDALSDRAELKRGVDEGSYNMNKAKKLGELFRRLVKHMGKKKLTLFIISQVRDNIGVTFGKKYRRSGGKALDFYASQVVYLSQVGSIKRTINGVERMVGVKIRAKLEKNKVGLPFREADFPIEFGYGVDDVTANLEFLDKVKRIDRLNFEIKAGSRLTRSIRKIKELPDEEFRSLSDEVALLVKEVWKEIEIGFLPKRRKY